MPATLKQRASLLSLVLVEFTAVFLISLAPTTLHIALPHLPGYFAISSDEASWIKVPGTVLFFFGLVIAPWLARWIGAKRLAILAMLLFTLTSLVGPLSTFAILVLAVAVRGLASGFILSHCLGLFATNVSANKRAALLGLLLIVYFTGGIWGPVAGGWLTDNFSFAWTLLMFAPAGLVLAILQVFVIPNPTLAL